MRIELIYHFNGKEEFWECPLCGQIFSSEEEANEHFSSEWLWLCETLIKIGEMLKRLGGG